MFALLPSGVGEERISYHCWAVRDSGPVLCVVIYFVLRLGRDVMRCSGYSNSWLIGLGML